MTDERLWRGHGDAREGRRDDAIHRRALEILERRRCSWVEAWTIALAEQDRRHRTHALDATGLPRTRPGTRRAGHAPLSEQIGLPRQPPAGAMAPGRTTLSAALPAPVMRSAEHGEVAPDALDLVARARRSGAPLDEALRAQLEAALGARLDAVRVHTGPDADAAARALGARAFAIGNDVVFRDGAYDPQQRDGRRLIAHEVAHTVQSTGAAAPTDGPLLVSQPDDAPERQADAFADRFVDTAPAIHASPMTSTEHSPLGGGTSTIHRTAEREPPAQGPGPADIAAVRAKLGAARALLADKTAPLEGDERKQLEAAVADAERALSAFDAVAGQGQRRAAVMAPLAVVGGGILGDDATGVGVADDPLLILVGIAALITMLATRPAASDRQIAQSWSRVVESLRTVATAGEALVLLKLNGERLRGNTRQLAAHLARLLALASVAGVPSGEPPKNNNDNDPHWWTEIKAFLKNIQSAIGKASRKQALRELQKKFTEEQILEIERQLAEAGRRMGEPPPPFLPPP